MGRHVIAAALGLWSRCACEAPTLVKLCALGIKIKSALAMAHASPPLPIVHHRIVAEAHHALAVALAVQHVPLVVATVRPVVDLNNKEILGDVERSNSPSAHGCRSWSRTHNDSVASHHALR